MAEYIPTAAASRSRSTPRQRLPMVQPCLVGTQSPTAAGIPILLVGGIAHRMLPITRHRASTRSGRTAKLSFRPSRDPSNHHGFHYVVRRIGLYRRCAHRLVLCGRAVRDGQRPDERRQCGRLRAERYADARHDRHHPPPSGKDVRRRVGRLYGRRRGELLRRCGCLSRCKRHCHRNKAGCFCPEREPHARPACRHSLPLRGEAGLYGRNAGQRALCRRAARQLLRRGGRLGRAERHHDRHESGRLRTGCAPVTRAQAVAILHRFCKTYST